MKGLINSKYLLITFLLLTSSAIIFAQTPSETPPPPSEPPTITIPKVHEMTLSNGLKVVVVQRRNVPLVTASLLVKSGANVEGSKQAGLANMTASLLIKGAGSRSATEIAEQIEFLGGSIRSGAGWNSSTVTINVMKNGLSRALSIMSDSTIRPTFPAKELKLLKKQTLDGFKARLKQPGALLSYVASIYSFNEHTTSGTPETIGQIGRKGVVKFHSRHYRPENSVLIFTGDISEKTAFGYARLFFGGWEKALDGYDKIKVNDNKTSDSEGDSEVVVKRLLVVDLPNSGQAAVGYAKRFASGRVSCDGANNCLSSGVYYPATVLNSVLGGGYSARLNQEIRLKRGLSYGARSGFAWRILNTNFTASTQTKNESAAHVAELIRIEIEKLVDSLISAKEMKPRKSVVTGGFGRGIQTNNGMAARLRGLYLFNLSPNELNSFMNKVQDVSDEEIKKFAADNLRGGDMIIVGDAKMFMDDLQKRFSNQTIEVIKASDLDLNSPTLRKNGRRRD